MFKTFLSVVLVGVVMAQSNKNTNKGAKYAKDADGNCQLECKEGYTQGDDCKCNAEDTVALTCKEGFNVNVEDNCACTSDSEKYFQKCYYGYQLDKSDCSCSKPVDCGTKTCNNRQGLYMNRDTCACKAKVACDTPCEKGFKQNPFTCECDAASYFTSDALCGWNNGWTQSLSSCQCQKEGVDSRAAECKRGYELNTSTCECEIEDEDQWIACPPNMGFD
jgi:hypothetical protein